MNTVSDSQREAHSQQAAAACNVAMSAITKLAASSTASKLPAIATFGVAIHYSQLKGHLPLAHNAAHSAARSVAKAEVSFSYSLPPHLMVH